MSNRRPHAARPPRPTVQASPLIGTQGPLAQILRGQEFRDFDLRVERLKLVTRAVRSTSNARSGHGVVDRVAGVRSFATVGGPVLSSASLFPSAA